MRPTFTRNKTITYKPPENWDQQTDGPCGDLEVRVQTHGDNRLPELVSTWKPDAEDIKMLNKGAVIELYIVTHGAQPPVGLAVVAPVEGFTAAEPEETPVGLPESGHITINEDAHGHG